MTTDASKIRVFIIDDHELIRLAIRSLVEDAEDMEIAGEASSGEDALSAEVLARADVVVCDMMLTGMDGVEATRRITEAYPGVKVLVLSAYGEEYLIPALEAGAVGYILKNTVHDEIIDQIHVAVAGGTPISSSLHGVLASRYRRADRSPELTPRQLEVLRKVAAGYHAGEVAAQLSVSTATVKRDLHQVFVTLGVRSQAHAVSEAQHKGIL
ncbi:MAG: response regulator transcription factor [Chloroflexota bacterium]